MSDLDTVAAALAKELGMGEHDYFFCGECIPDAPCRLCAKTKALMMLNALIRLDEAHLVNVLAAARRERR
jgi:hypothetical protein